MRTLAAYINGQPVDYLKGGDFPIAISRDVSEAQDLTKRGGDATLSFKLPATANNRQIFGDLYIPEGVNQFYVAAPYRFTLIVDGETVLNNAALTVRKANEDSIECYAIATNINWANLLAAKNLRQIQSLRPFVLTNGDEITACNAAVNTSDPNRYDHPDEFDVVFPLTAYGQFFVPNIWGAQNKISQVYYSFASQALPDGKYIFGLDTYQLGKGGNAHFTFETYAPAIYLRAIFRAIFADIGYRFVSSFFDVVESKKLILPFTGERNPQWNWATLATAEFSSDGSIAGELTISNFTFIESIDGTWVMVAWSLTSGGTILSPRSFSSNNGYLSTVNAIGNSVMYRAPILGTYRVRVKLSGTKILHPGFYKYYVVVLMSPGAASLSELYGDIIVDLPNATDATFDPTRVAIVGELSHAAGIFNFDSFVDVQLQTNQKIDIAYIAIDLSPATGNFVLNITNFEYTVTNIDSTVDLEPALQLPNMTQLEFIKRMTAAFDLYYDIDDENGIAYVDTRNNFYDSYQNAIDLTDYLRRNSGDVYPNPQAKTYRFQHLEDSNDYLTVIRGGFLRYSHTETNPVRDAVGDKIVSAGFAPTEYELFRLVDDTTTSSFLLPQFETVALLNLPVISDSERYFAYQNDALIAGDSNFDFDLRIVKVKSNTTLPSGAFLPYRVYDPTLGDVYRQIDFYIETVFDDIPNPVTNPIPTPAPQLWSLTYEKNKYGLFRLYLPQILELEKGFQADYDVVLTPQLFRQLSLRRIVKIGGAIFRLVKIEQFKPGSTSPTKIVLSRIT